MMNNTHHNKYELTPNLISSSAILNPIYNIVWNHQAIYVWQTLLIKINNKVTIARQFFLYTLHYIHYHIIGWLKPINNFFSLTKNHLIWKNFLTKRMRLKKYWIRVTYTYTRQKIRKQTIREISLGKNVPKIKSPSPTPKKYQMAVPKESRLILHLSSNSHQKKSTLREVDKTNFPQKLSKESCTTKMLCTFQHLSEKLHQGFYCC